MGLQIEKRGYNNTSFCREKKKRKYFRKTFFLLLEIGKNSFAKEDEVVVKT